MEECRKRPEGVEAGAELKMLIVEASRALARLDTGRLEELAISCQALNRRPIPGNVGGQRLLERQAREAVADMAVFARVLDATRANLHVMNRLRALRMGQLEYSERQARGATEAEAGHGNN